MSNVVDFCLLLKLLVRFADIPKNSEFDENSLEIPKERYTSPEKHQQITDNFRII